MFTSLYKQQAMEHLMNLRKPVRIFYVRIINYFTVKYTLNF